jgi:hypothetical protein
MGDKVFALNCLMRPQISSLLERPNVAGPSTPGLNRRSGRTLA